MQALRHIGSLTLAASVAATLLLSAPASAASRHHHHRHHRMPARHYHMSMSGMSQLGTYPNVRYFRSNGHIYARNIDDGFTWLVR